MKTLSSIFLFLILQSQSVFAFEDIYTDKAPSPIGTYSQAIKVDNTVYLSGQIGMLPVTGELVGEKFEEQINQIFSNIEAVTHAAGGDFSKISKLTVFLTDLKYFPLVNEAMQKRFLPPYPARSAVEVKALPKGALVEIEAIMSL